MGHCGNPRDFAVIYYSITPRSSVAFFSLASRRIICFYYQRFNGNVKMNINDEEVLEFFVAPGAQYVSHIGTQIFGSDQPQKPEQEAPSTGATPPLPEVLATPEAMRLWEKVQRAGYVDDDCQPTCSRPEAAMLANEMAKRLGIREKWKVFEAFWHRNNMRSDYSRAMNQRQSLDFQDKIKRLFCSI